MGDVDEKNRVELRVVVEGWRMKDEALKDLVMKEEEKRAGGAVAAAAALKTCGRTRGIPRRGLAILDLANQKSVSATGVHPGRSRDETTRQRGPVSFRRGATSCRSNKKSGTALPGGLLCHATIQLEGQQGRHLSSSCPS